MKTANKIVVVIVFLLVLLFGVGQFFTASVPIAPSASSTQSTSGTTASSTPVIPPTTLIKYVPSQPSASIKVVNGSCWTNSIAAPFRADAWRCTVGNNISDPCFQIPNSANLLCNINPTVTNATSSFVLKLTKPLPKPQIPQGLAPKDWAWLIQLSDGTLCTPFTGTLPAIAGDHSANYSCAPGPLGDNLLIFDDLDTSRPVWTADVGTLSQNGTSTLPTIATSQTVTIAGIWQEGAKKPLSQAGTLFTAFGKGLFSLV